MHARERDVAALVDLQRRGPTMPARTGVLGRLNGGLLVVAVMEQRPELLPRAPMPGRRISTPCCVQAGWMS